MVRIPSASAKFASLTWRHSAHVIILKTRYPVTPLWNSLLNIALIRLLMRTTTVAHTC